MDAPAQTSPPEQKSETPPTVHHEVTPKNPDFIPPSVQKPSKYRYVWLALIVFLVLSVVGGGAYIIDAENKQAPSEISALLTPTPGHGETVTVAPTTPPIMHVTYTDPTLGYSFKYPNTLTQSIEKTGEVVLTDSGGTHIITLSATNNQKKFIDMNAFESCSVVINDAYTGKANKCVTSDNKPVQFGTNQASHFVYIEVGNSGGGYDIYQTVDPAIQFMLTFSSGKQDGEKVFAEILPTFTFNVATPSATPSAGQSNQ